jgi:PAS domain S-box-containing protein
MDISEQKRAEEERRRLAAAVEYAADAIMVTDAEWVVQYVNPAFEKVTGYAKEEVLGRNLYALAAYGENMRVYLGIKDRIRSGSPWKGRLKNRRKDGVHLEQDIVISPIRDPGGKVVNHVVAARDITREAFLQKQAQTAQRMEAVGTLAGGIAHDFNNALTGIIGFADLLRMRLEKQPKLQGDVDEILKCAERASTLTRQLLAFARRQVIEPVSLGLNTVVRDLSRLMKKVSGEQIEVRTRLTEGIPHIFADRGQLEQVLLNLCLNSRDAMPGGGEFLVSTDAVAWEEERVEDQAVMPAGQYVLLAVADNGSGMDDATRKHAFEPYFTTKASGKGTGLGLSMVYGIVKQNRGFIFLDTRPEGGTTFRIYFPAPEAVSEGKEEKEEEKEEAAVRGGAETILLAEDEEAIRNLAERSLRGYGYEVLVARDGAEAVALCEAHPEIAIAVLDVVMPRMGGKEALDAMRRIRPDLKAVFTSGYSTDRIHESFVLLPGIEFLPKPYSPASLAQRVREVLDKI